MCRYGLWGKINTARCFNRFEAVHQARSVVRHRKARIAVPAQPPRAARQFGPRRAHHRARVDGKDQASSHGPYPGDTVPWPPTARKFDAVVAMYHDQGLITVKMAGFDRAGNVTLGFDRRTRPDHGRTSTRAKRANPGSSREDRVGHISVKRHNRASVGMGRRRAVSGRTDAHESARLTPAHQTVTFFPAASS